MSGSIRDMKKLLRHPDANQAAEEDFPFAEAEDACRYCFFRKACPRWS